MYNKWILCVRIFVYGVCSDYATYVIYPVSFVVVFSVSNPNYPIILVTAYPLFYCCGCFKRQPLIISCAGISYLTGCPLSTKQCLYKFSLFFNCNYNAVLGWYTNKLLVGGLLTLGTMLIHPRGLPIRCTMLS